MKIFQPACRDRNWICVKNETCAHCLDKQCMSNSDIFVSVAGMECSSMSVITPKGGYFDIRSNGYVPPIRMGLEARKSLIMGFAM